MLNEKDVALVYETLLSTPGMTDVVKLDVKIPRKTVLLLVNVIGKGLQMKPGDALEGLLSAAGEDSADLLRQVCSELLQKAGLSAMNEKLQSLQVPLGGKDK